MAGFINPFSPIRRALGVQPTAVQSPMTVPGAGRDLASNALMALGIGIANNDLSTGAAMLPNMMSATRTKSSAYAQKKQAADYLRAQEDPELADAVLNGLMDPEQAFTEYLTRKKTKNAPIKDEYGVERNPDGSFRNKFDEERYNREKSKAELEMQEQQGKISKGQLEMEKLKREQEQDQKAQELTAPKGARDASIGTAFDSIYKNLGVDPETGQDIPGGGPRKSFIDKMIPEALGDRATGLGSVLSVIPGTTARDLSADVDTLISEIITSEVAKLKAAGVSFGQITEYENKMFARLQGSLDLGQGREQVIRNIRILDEAMKRNAETGQPLLENDPVLEEISRSRQAPAADTNMAQPPAPGGMPDVSTMSDEQLKAILGQ